MTAAPVMPRLGAVGWARLIWRRLTSMSTALSLLLLLAIASIPGSLIPQSSSDPNGVISYRRSNPDLRWLTDLLQLHDVYGSPWFSAIYLLLFISLVGCVIPRIRLHLTALRSQPPRPPSRFARLPVHRTLPSDDVRASLDDVARRLRRRGYRVVRFGDQVSAERGYLKETGNLVFHVALLGVLISLGLGSGYRYTGQKILVEGEGFGNTRATYDSFTPGRLFTDDMLTPFTLQLDDFEASYRPSPIDGSPQPLDFVGQLSSSEWEGTRELKVNGPVEVGGTWVYLLGNGFAPVITVRDASGAIAFSQPVAFLAQDAQLTSLGVVKVPDAVGEQLGFLGFFYPTAVPLPSGALASASPDPDVPVMSLDLYTGDLGLDDGTPQSAYQLNTDEMERRTGGDTGVESLTLGLGDTLPLPNGLGSITFEELRRFVGVDMSSDPTQLPVLVSSTAAFVGLLAALSSRRRRVWARAGDEGIEIGALSRGDDPGLDDHVDRLLAPAPAERSSPS
jgi:cytochrome c biogenesis protein